MPSRFLLSDSPPPSVGEERELKVLIILFVSMAPLAILYLIIALAGCLQDESDDPPAGPENPVSQTRTSSRPPLSPTRRCRESPTGGHHSQQPRELVQHHHSPTQPVRATTLVDSGLPIEFFSEETRLRLRLTGVEEGCVICLSDFKLGETLTILPECNHGFHTMCIERWWKESHSCPTCRTMYL